MKTAIRFGSEVLLEDTNTVEQYPTVMRAKERVFELVGQGYFASHATYPAPHDLLVGRQVKVGQLFTVDQMKAVFDKVAPKGDWKGRIDAVVDERELDIVCEAVSYYTATEVEFFPIPKKDGGYEESTVRVQALGYRMGPAGDH